MRRPAVTIATVLCVVSVGVMALVGTLQVDNGERNRSIVVSDLDGAVLARLSLPGDTFAVSYRNSIYETVAEERYDVAEDGSYRLSEIAADQLAVIEEYYAVPGVPEAASQGDRRAFVVAPDPDHPAVFDSLSIAATDLGERTVHISGSAPFALWQLVDDDRPFLSLEIKETP